MFTCLIENNSYMITCVNTAFSQVFSFSEMNLKIQFATKNLTLFYGVRFCSFILFSVQ